MGFSKARRNYFRKRKTEGIKLTSVEVQWLGIKGTWVADRAQQQAAWEMYVELATRVATQSLAANHGLIREALTSLHSLFGETRRILREHGPSVLIPAEEGALSFAEIALVVLNRHLRPFLADWHPRLQAHEVLRADGGSAAAHEQAWEDGTAIRTQLETVRKVLSSYAALLCRACGVSPVHL